MSFADFEEHDTEDLQLAQYLYKELKIIHLEGLDQDQIANLEDEIRERLFKLEDYLLEDGPAKREIIEPFNRLMRIFDFHYVDTGGRKWTEIDFETDFEKAKTFEFEQKGGEK